MCGIAGMVGIEPDYTAEAADVHQRSTTAFSRIGRAQGESPRFYSKASPEMFVWETVTVAVPVFFRVT